MFFAVVDKERDFQMIEDAGALAKQAVEQSKLDLLAKAVELTYQMQLKEGMQPLVM